MQYQEIKPHPALANHVRFFWTLEHQVPYDTPTDYQLFADSCPGMVFHYNNQFTEQRGDGVSGLAPTAVFGCQNHQFRTFSARGGFGFFGVYFYPYALPDLFGVAASECTNNFFSIKDLLGPIGSELDEIINTATDNNTRIKLTTAFLLQRLQNSKPEADPIKRYIQQMLSVDRTYSVQTLRRMSGLSDRQAERRFRFLSGFRPKLFSRVLRFQNSLFGIERRPIESLAQWALELGYSDQSHFNREFKEFSGMRPRQYYIQTQMMAGNFVQNGQEQAHSHSL